MRLLAHPTRLIPPLGWFALRLFFLFAVLCILAPGCAEVIAASASGRCQNPGHTAVTP